ncbi:MAG: TrkA family potassium uptake protein [Clostridiaceae bacterium]|nr:TrkA family potassium uptake protein [Clostridiaceae bacterium]
MRSMLVIGLGHFGTHLALKLSELGNEVMVVDRDEEAVNKIAPQVTTALVGDCMSPEILKSLGVGNFDICFVCISDNFQSSLEITSLLKDLGARYVISKTDRDIHAKFLRRIGADEVIFPERDMAQRTAFRCSARNAFQYIELTPEYAIFEMSLPDNWSGKSVKQLNVRSRHNINIIAVKRNEHVVPITSPDYVFAHNEHIFVAGSKQDLIKLMDKN